MSKEEQNLFIELGVITALKESIANFEKEVGGDATNLCSSVPE